MVTKGSGLHHDYGALERRVSMLEGRVDELSRQVFYGKRVEVDGESSAKVDGELMKLTMKQHAAMQLVLAGKSNAQIAEVFECEESTAKVHVRGAMLRMGAMTRPHFILKVKPLMDKVDADSYRLAAGIPKDWADRWNSKGYERYTDLVRRMRNGKDGVDGKGKT